MKERKYLSKEQKEYIVEHYPFDQTKRIADYLGVSIKQVSGYAWSKGIKKSKDFVVIRVDNSLTIEQQDFIFENYSIMSNKDISEKLNVPTNLISAFSRQHNLKKENNLLNSNSKVSLEKRKFVLENYETMLTKDIAKITGLEENWIRCYAYLHGIRRDRDAVQAMCENKNGLTNEQKKFIIENYSKMTDDDISKVIDVDKSKIHNYASNKKLKKSFEVLKKRDNYFDVCLKERTNIDYKIINFLGKKEEPKVLEENLYKSKYGKYSLNQNYFERIDNEWKAYWLGFLYADGCVQHYTKNKKSKNTVSLALKEDDSEHIQKFLDSLQSNSPIKHYKTNYKNYYAVKAIISNKKICEDLITHGCFPNKTYTLKFPNLRKDLIRHFIRGYFDGDGCVCVNLEKRFVRVNMVGNDDILKNICYHLLENCNASIPVFQKKNPKSNIYSIQWGNVYTCKKIYQYLYKNSNISLDRKLKKFDTIYCLE